MQDKNFLILSKHKIDVFVGQFYLFILFIYLFMPYILFVGFFSTLNISKKCFSIPARDSWFLSLMFLTFLSKSLLCYYKFILSIPIFTSDFILIVSVLFVKNYF